MVLEKCNGLSEGEVTRFSQFQGPEVEGLSKNAKKKLNKKLRRAQTKISYLEIRRELRKKKRKITTLKRREALQKGEPVKKKNVIKRMADSMSTQRIVIDLNYENFMSEKERMSLAKQLEFCYSSNRYSAQPFQLYFTSTVDIIVSERFVQTIPYWRSWDVFWKNENFMHLFKSEDLVYLTGDSPNILIDLDPKSVYIIGGLVDHNRHKGLTLRRAESCGIRHACLPIAEHLKLSSSKVLTVDQVFKILVEFQNCNDWLGALLAVVPSRKLLRLNSGDHPTVTCTKKRSLYHRRKCQPADEGGPGEQGTFGEVFECKNAKDESVAVKQIKIDSQSLGFPASSLREVAILQELRHPNIVRLMDVYLSECIIYLVFEYLDCDLRAFLSRTKKTSKELQKSFFKQILKAVAYCHSHCVIHRDIKPENILVSSERIIKLADFGLSRTFEIPKRTYSPEVLSMIDLKSWRLVSNGANRYRSIEILLSDGEYSAAADIWSVGCVFVELCGHDALFPGKRSMDQIFIIVQKLGTKNIKLLHLPSFVSHLPDFPSPSGRIVKGMNEVENDLLLRMLQYDVKERITAGQALRHQYFDS